MKNVRRGDVVSLKVRVFTEPILERGAICTVSAVNEIRGRRMVSLRGPEGQVFQVRPGDVQGVKQ